MQRQTMSARRAITAAILAIPLDGPCEQPPESGFVMKPAVLFTDKSADTKIIGGSKSDPRDWPATLVFLRPDGRGCTSTVVSGRVVLTAAHCVANHSRGGVELGEQRIDTTCDHHPDYRATPETDPEWEEKAIPDFALCLLATALPGSAFENVNRDPSAVHLNDTVRLLGFGCNKAGGSDGGFGVLYEGDAYVKRLPQPPSYYTLTSGGAAVCSGDSGGGAYLCLNPERTRRVLMGVNSRGNLSTRSGLSTTSEEGFVSWAITWAAAHQVRICGLHDDAIGCRPK